MARRTITTAALGALAGAVLGIMAMAVTASILTDAGSAVVIDPTASRSRPEFLVTSGALNLYVVIAALLGGLLIALITVGLIDGAGARSRRSTILIVAAGGAAAVIVGFAAFRTGFGIGGGTPFETDAPAGVVSLSVFRAVILAAISGIGVGAAAAVTTFILASPELLGLGGEAWPTRATFLRESAAAVAVPAVGLLAAAGFVFGFSRILLAGSSITAVVTAAVVAALVLGGAAFIAANPPPLAPNAVLIVGGMAVIALVTIAVSFAVSEDEESGTHALGPETAQQLVAPAPYVAAFTKAGCGGCHTIPGIPGANGTVGPNLDHIGADAPTRVAGLSGAEYIRQSILEPNAFIAPACPSGPCPSGVMLQTFADSLSGTDLDTIVSYLEVLGTDTAVALGSPDTAVVALDLALPAESGGERFQPLPEGRTAPDAQIALGKILFFDPRLSGNNSLSCSSCHMPDAAFSDGLAISDGYPSTQYFRNTPTLYNSGFADLIYWDGRLDGSDMATVVRDHLTEAHFMSMDGRLMVERLNQTPAYVAAFEEAFGGGPSFGRVLNALAGYTRSLVSGPSPYDGFTGGDTAALSSQASAGLELFNGKAGCAACHSGPLFTSTGFADIGIRTDPSFFDDPALHVTFRRFFRTLGVPDFRDLRQDVGRYAVTLDPADWGQFRIPGLREVGRTGPYMHDGSVATLEDVVSFYNAGGGAGQTAGLQPLGLNDAEIAELVAFLQSLSSDPIAVEVPDLPEYRTVPLGGG